MRSCLVLVLLALGFGCSGSSGAAAKAAAPAAAVAIQGAGNHYGTLVFDDGSFVVAGDAGGDLVFHSTGSGPVQAPTGGGRVYYLAAYDASLTLLWTRILPGEVGFRDLVQAPDGTIVVLCEVYENATIDGTVIDLGPGTRAVLLLRYTRGGQPLGITHIAHGDPDVGRCAYAADGSLYVAMRTRDGMTLDPLGNDPLPLPTPPATWALHVVRYAPGGARAWVRSGTADNALWSSAITAMSGGDCVVAASYYADGVFFGGTPDEVVPPTAEDYRGVLFRLDAQTGALEWFHDLEGRVSIDFLRDAGDGVLATGDILNAATFGAGQPNERAVDSPNRYTGFVARYANDGTLRWVRLVTDGAEGAYVASADVASDGTIVVAGTGKDDTTFEGGANPDLESQHAKAFVATYDRDGNLENAWTAETSGWASANDGVLAPDGSIILNGDHEEDILLPGGIALPAPGPDGANFLLRLPLD